MDWSRLRTTELMLWGIEVESRPRPLEVWIPGRREGRNGMAARTPLYRMVVRSLELRSRADDLRWKCDAGFN